MLQQILQDMWVDPELLSELDDGQKQTLFCRMREEQVRRWKLWDDQTSERDDKRPKSTYSNKKARNVGFLLGQDGEPWTWVMGDHEDDRSIDQILEQEAREEARKMAEKEAQQLRQSVEAELSELLDLNQKQIEAMEAAQIKDDNTESLGIYNTVEELNERIHISNPKTVVRKTLMNNINRMDNIVAEKRETLNEISLNKSQPKNVSQRVAQWEKKVVEERQNEIFNRLQKNQKQASKEAEEAERNRDELWRESERKAKEAEQQIREIARRAREEHRRTSVQDMEVDVNSTCASPTHDMSLSPISMGSISPTQREDLVPNPANKEAVCDWFRGSELLRGAGLEKDMRHVAPWFHGLITRQEAELLLNCKPKGTFLVRVSEKIWGYAISYQAGERCKHYLIDAYGEHYQFFNHNQTAHLSLGDFIRYYSKNPITTAGQELLIKPCPRVGIPDIFTGSTGMLEA